MPRACWTTLAPQCSPRRPVGVKPKRARTLADMRLDEARSLQARGQLGRVDGDERVADVEQLEQRARGEAVRARENTPRSQHPRHLLNHPVLQRPAWEMVEHREADDAREATIRERHLGRVPLL